jgi:hypothetical protein
VVTSTFDEWTASLGGNVSPEARSFLQGVFDERGPISRDEAERIGHDHQVALARKAVGLLGHDIAATTELTAPSFEYREEDGSIRLSIWGSYATDPIFGLSQAHVTVEVADFVHEEVIDGLHALWPECHQHRVGLHPSLAADRAVWICHAGAHEVADIGKLTT